MKSLSTIRVFGASLGLLAGLPHASAEEKTWQDYTARNRTASTCPDYNKYAQEPHGPYSDGPLALPYMRPSPECRTFNSSAVEVSIFTLL
jgi:hypothetical protein